MRWCALFVAVSSWAAPLYTVTALGTDTGVASVAFDINHSGEAAGHTTSRFNANSAVRWGSGSVQTLGASAQADSIAPNGAVAGTTWTGPGARATVWGASGAWYLDVGTESYGLGINASGRVVGSVTENGRTHAFVYDRGTLTDIGGPWQWSAAYDISDSGHVAGTYDLGGGAFRAFSWSASTGFQDLGTLGGLGTYAMAVNEKGQVAGSSTMGTQPHAFLYENGTMRDLGTLGLASMAYDVNGKSDVVGVSYDSAGRGRAFVWRDGMLYDLNLLLDTSAGWALGAAYGINDRGQIVGSGWYEGRQMAFRLDPIFTGAAPPLQASDSTAPVPEPETFTLAAVALVLLAGGRLLVSCR